MRIHTQHGSGDEPAVAIHGAATGKEGTRSSLVSPWRQM